MDIGHDPHLGIRKCGMIQVLRILSSQFASSALAKTNASLCRPFTVIGLFCSFMILSNVYSYGPKNWVRKMKLSEFTAGGALEIAVISGFRRPSPGKIKQFE
jgi:hypothetical protein